MKRITLVLVIIFFAQLINAQVAFSTTPDTVNVLKPATFEFFYDYVLFDNNTSDTLHMRWKKVFLEVDPLAGHGGNNGWHISIQDPTQYHSSAYAMDSADFYLPTIPTGLTNKFILHVVPNNYPGTLHGKYLFYPINDLSDTSSVILNYEATEVVSTQSFSDGKVEVFPNPINDYVKINNLSTSQKRVRLVNMGGESLASAILSAESQLEIPVDQYASGIYFLVFENERETVIQKIEIQK